MDRGLRSKGQSLAFEVSAYDPLELARSFLGAPIDRVEQVGGGRNSRLFYVEAGDRRFALKIYPPFFPGARDRASIECRALSFMRTHGIKDVPAVVARSRDAALLEWIAGDPVAEPSLEDMDLAARFLGRIHTLKDRDGAAEFGCAAEACLCGAEILSQTMRRLERLEAEAGDHEALAQYLRREFRPRLSEVTGNVMERCRRSGIPFNREISWVDRTLVPADFGFHNALRRPDGGTTFLDFEYFGWDDPVKVCLDFALHPGMNLAPELVRQFLGAVTQVYGTDSAFAARLAAYFQLIGLRWCAILLNEFLPDVWARRQHSGNSADRLEILRRQLHLSRSMLVRLDADLKDF